ncbi:MAG: amidohydrolase [Planctomycetota bacterium]|nr:amidohydrolase [Planctomycetota bacterium]
MNAKLAAPRNGYIDVHTHLFKGDLPQEEEMDLSLRLATAAGVALQIELGNLRLGTPTFARPDPEGIAKVNNHTIKAVQRHPDRFVGFCYLNPANPVSASLEEMERCIVEGPLRGLKFEISVNATSPLMDPIFERARELGIPVLHHAWYNMEGNQEHESTAADVAHLARRHPEVTIVMAHLGGARERGVQDIADCPNVLVDTSGSYPEAGHVEYAVRRLGARRVVYGSDWPCRDYATQVGRILGADLKPEERDLVLRGNAARVLGLEGVHA